MDHEVSIDNANHVTVIAEIGVNHDGKLHNALELIDQAKICGADFVKFQTFKAENLVTGSAKRAEYQITNTRTSETQREMLQRLELSEDDHLKLLERCKSNQIEFLSTGFDIESVSFLADLGVEFFKIPSGELTNLPYLRFVGSLKREIVISSGMADMEELSAAINELLNGGASRGQITALHCTTEYPTPIESVNLSAMRTIAELLQVRVGYSDHTIGPEVSLAAVAMGAKVIEKHFTLDSDLPGPDHSCSMMPVDFKNMISNIRSLEIAIGDGIKIPTQSEIQTRSFARKSIVASKRISRGDLLSDQNITTKRPGIGISPMLWFDVVGTSAVRDFEIDELIELQ